jgi:gamma-glutamyltranspeptidase
MPQGRPSTLARDGIVCAPHFLAAQAGLAILQAGGNAVDAALAASAALTVVYPILCGIGGDMFMLLFDASSDALYALDAAGRAGTHASPERVRAAGHTVMPARGALAVSVPGVVDGWAMAAERFGKLGLARCLQPAIRYAEQGFGVTPLLARSLALVAGSDWIHESWLAAYAPGGVAPKAGDVQRVPELVRTLRLIAEQGRDVMYQGEAGQAIAAFLEQQGGFVTAEDLAVHHGRWVEPLSIDYHGHTIYELPPPTQGVAALQALRLMHGLPHGADPLDAATVHPQVEAKKLAFADRAQYLSDPAFMRAEPRALLDDGYLDERRRLIDLDRARPAEAGVLRGDTIYLCAADGAGNAVSLIQSNYMGIGSGLVVPGYGVPLQNRGAYFSLDADHVNVIAPRKQPLHTLIPSLAMRDGRPSIVLGTQGGDGQPQIQQQLYSMLIDFDLDVQAAIELPRWVHGRGMPGDPPGLMLESRFPAATIEQLRMMGHRVALTDAWTGACGHAQAIVLDPRTGLLAGGADPRADGLAAGY